MPVLPTAARDFIGENTFECTTKLMLEVNIVKKFCHALGRCLLRAPFT